MIPISVLKTTVIVMGVLIVAGLVVIIMKISQKTGELAENMVATDAEADTPTETVQGDAASFRLDLDQLGLNADARLLGMDVAGERLVLRVQTGIGVERVVIVDVKSGVVVGEVALPPAKQ